MEVHHASHHDRPRSLKSFAFEFLMIAIAVFVGSLGEYFLDHRIIEERLHNGLVSMREDLDTDLRNLDRIIAQCDSGIEFLIRTRQSAVEYQTGKLSGAEYLRRLVDDLPNVYIYHTFFMDRTSFTNLSSAGLMNVEDSAELRAAISEYYEVYGKRLNDNNALLDKEAIAYYERSFPLQSALESGRFNIEGRQTTAQNVDIYLRLPTVREKLLSGELIPATDQLILRVADYKDILIEMRRLNREAARLLRDRQIAS
ncbi:MAG: hypothetical protein RL321_1361 [Pseudomonadota bacterium]|jgi:hypothetical protein